MDDTPIIHNGTDNILAHAFERNNAAIWKALPGRVDGWFSDDPDFVGAVINGPLAANNAVVLAQLGPAEANLLISEFVAKLIYFHVPGMWWLGPSAQPADLAERLLRFGFAENAGSPILVCDLTGLAAKADPPELTITQLGDDVDLEALSDCYLRGFDIPANAHEFTRYYLCQAEFQMGRWFVGWHGGAPVALAMLMPAAGVAGIWNVCVVPEGRGKGYGEAVTRAAMSAGRTLGYRYAALNPTRAGLPLYRRLGFREIARYREFEWHPKDLPEGF